MKQCNTPPLMRACHPSTLKPSVWSPYRPSASMIPQGTKCQQGSLIPRHHHTMSSPYGIGFHPRGAQKEPIPRGQCHPHVQRHLHLPPPSAHSQGQGPWRGTVHRCACCQAIFPNQKKCQKKRQKWRTGCLPLSWKGKGGGVPKKKRRFLCPAFPNQIQACSIQSHSNPGTAHGLPAATMLTMPHTPNIGFPRQMAATASDKRTTTATTAHPANPQPPPHNP